MDYDIECPSRIEAMMRSSLLLVLAIAISPSLHADFEAGKVAFAKGDYETALKEWQPLAERGLPFAAYNVALLYSRGQGVKKDPTEAVKWYKIAAEKGIPEAQYNLGVMYSSGIGVPQDYMQASQWFQRAAEKGDANAANSLGTLYDSGDHSFHDASAAEKWYRKAAEEGNSDAQFNLGVMYDIGHGVKISFPEAEKWYRKAADQWNEGALCNLAILYYNGDGVKRDLVQAHTYYLLAKEAGDARAANLMELTTEKLSKKQIAQAEQNAAEFKQTHAAQIAKAKNPLLKPPSPDSVGPEVAGVYQQPVGASPAPAESGSSVTSPANTPGVWTGIERVVAVGDLHGDYYQFLSLLQSAGMVDSAGKWSGGRAHLVQTGDVVDEGPDGRRIMDMLMRLESESQQAGGMVHCLIGNHEAMDIYGDLRFVSPAAFQAYATADSANVREQAYLAYQTGQGKYNLKVTPKEEWTQQHPLGFFEQRAAFSPEGKYGKWLLRHNTAIRINDTLYSHAGVGPKYADYTLDKINNEVRDELLHTDKLADGITTDLQGPLWYRGLSDDDAHVSLDATLKHFGVVREVVGHVDAGAAIMTRYGNRVILIDVGLSRAPTNTGRQACLIEEKGHLYALHRGTRIAMPKDDGPDMLRYLKQAAALDPEPSPLASRIKLLETK